jgi:hypothetical protein
MTTYFGVNRSQVTWQGSRSFTNSSPGVTRGFCSQCGTPLHYMTTRWPGETHVFAATLDNPAQFTATEHVHWAERVSWLNFDDSLPKYEGRSR